MTRSLNAIELARRFPMFTAFQWGLMTREVEGQVRSSPLSHGHRGATAGDAQAFLDTPHAQVMLDIFREMAGEKDPRPNEPSTDYLFSSAATAFIKQGKA